MWPLVEHLCDSFHSHLQNQGLIRDLISFCRSLVNSPGIHEGWSTVVCFELLLDSVVVSQPPGMVWEVEFLAVVPPARRLEDSRPQCDASISRPSPVDASAYCTGCCSAEGSFFPPARRPTAWTFPKLQDSVCESLVHPHLRIDVFRTIFSVSTHSIATPFLTLSTLECLPCWRLLKLPISRLTLYPFSAWRNKRESCCCRSCAPSSAGIHHPTQLRPSSSAEVRYTFRREFPTSAIVGRAVSTYFYQRKTADQRQVHVRDIFKTTKLGRLVSYLINVIIPVNGQKLLNIIAPAVPADNDRPLAPVTAGLWQLPHQAIGPLNVHRLPVHYASVEAGGLWNFCKSAFRWRGGATDIRSASKRRWPRIPEVAAPLFSNSYLKPTPRLNLWSKLSWAIMTPWWLRIP